jgi:ElaB/YqjD/DUF883 family membrane-anchored ribosome-binding protein
MDVVASIIELKSNSLDRVEEWATTLKERANEAIETLRDSIKKAHEVVQSSPHAIDAYHQQFKKDTWVTGKSARLLVDLVDVNREKEAD